MMSSHSSSGNGYGDDEPPVISSNGDRADAFDTSNKMETAPLVDASSIQSGDNHALIHKAPPPVGHVTDSAASNSHPPGESAEITEQIPSTTDSKPDPVQEFKRAELDGYWLAVRRDPTDFTSWTGLLDYVEKEDNLDNLRQAFDTFLHKYPYCYGYWSKYADVEKRHENYDLCLQVFERGISAIPLSIDLWLSYIETVKELSRTKEDAIQRIRGVYSRALDTASMDFRSDRLWESYIQWELSTNTPDSVRNVTALYDRLIYTPTQTYYQNWENFKRHMEENSVQELFSAEEFQSLKREILREMGQPEDGMVSDMECIRMRDKAREVREEIYNRTYEEITKRWHFEEHIRRPYFHVKPLEASQLSNWQEYLDFEEAELANCNAAEDPTRWAMQRARVLFLYERCLVACALYEEMWLRYARYAEHTLLDVETARNVWRRVCTIHLPARHSLRWQWACFEERYITSKEEFKGPKWRTHPAWQSLEEAMLDDSGFYYPHEEHRNNPLVHTRRLDMMRRLGASHEEIVAAHEASLKHFTEEGSHSAAVSLIAARLARYLTYHMKDTLRAKSILQEAVERDQRSERLFIQLLDLVFHMEPHNVDAFCAVVDMAVERSLLPVRSKLVFAKRRLQYLEEFDTDIDRIRTAQEDFERLLKARAHVEESSGGGHVGDGPDAKRAMMALPADPFAAAAYPPAPFGAMNPPPNIPVAPAPTFPPTGPPPPVGTAGWEQYSAYYYGNAFGPGAYPPPSVPPPTGPPPSVPSVAYSAV